MICRSGATGGPRIAQFRAGLKTGITNRLFVRRVKGAAICAALISIPAIWTFSSGASAAAGAGACDAGSWTVIEATWVTDARTIALGDGRAVRLAGLESLAALARDPKTADAMDARLAGRLAQWLAAKPLRIRILPGKPDRHDRRAALIATGGELLQEHLLSAGLAVFMPESFPDDAGDACARRLLALEDGARLARRGGWSEPGLIVAAARPDVLSPQYGHFVIFQGIVRSVGTRRDRTYIDFGGQWRNDVTVEITAGRRRYFGGEAALEDLAGKLVRVRGFLQEKSGPMVSARHPAQIEVLVDTKSR